MKSGSLPLPPCRLAAAPSCPLGTSRCSFRALRLGPVWASCCVSAFVLVLVFHGVRMCVCVCACTHVCERWTTVEADVKRYRFMVGDRGREIHRSAVGARKRPEPFLHVLDGAWPQLPSVLRSRLFSVLHTGSLAYLVRHRIWEEERGNLPGLATPHLLREASHHISLETQ